MSAVTVWLTGLPSAGKTTIARAISEDSIYGEPWEVLDWDELRASPLSDDLGFSEEDRRKQVRRVAYLAQRLNRHGVNVVVALVSPWRAVRAEARAICGARLR